MLSFDLAVQTMESEATTAPDTAPAAEEPTVWELAGQAVAAAEQVPPVQPDDAVQRGAARFLQVAPHILAFLRGLDASHGQFVVRRDSPSPLVIIADTRGGGTTVRVCTVVSPGGPATALGRAVGDADGGMSFNGRAYTPFKCGDGTNGFTLLHFYAEAGALVRCRSTNVLGNAMYPVALTGVSAARDAVRGMRVDEALRRHAPVFPNEVVEGAPTINDVAVHFQTHRVAYAAAGHRDDLDAFIARVRGDVAGYGWPACLLALADVIAPLAYLGLRVKGSQEFVGRAGG